MKTFACYAFGCIGILFITLGFIMGRSGDPAGGCVVYLIGVASIIAAISILQRR